jgi:hypothetical protein
MKKIIAIAGALMFLLALAAPLAFSQDASAKPAAQDAAAEAAAYKAWYDANNAKDYPKALELAKAYLEKYPNGQYAAYLKKWVPQASAAISRTGLAAAVQAKNVAEIDRIGKEIMASDPESLDFALYLASQLRTLDTNFQYSADTSQFAQTAIRLIEAGKKPTNSASFNAKETEAYLHDTLATIEEHNKSTDKALEHYDQAAMIDPMNARYFFNCGRLHQARYAVAADEFQKKFTAEERSAPEPKPEVKAALDKVNVEADGVINCWARFIALPKNDYSADVKDKVEKALKDLYQYRNNNSLDGYQKLIDANKTSPTPVKMSPPQEPKPQAAADQKPADAGAAKAGNGQPAAAKAGNGQPATAAKPAPTKKPRM